MADKQQTAKTASVAQWHKQTDRETDKQANKTHELPKLLRLPKRSPRRVGLTTKLTNIRCTVVPHTCVWHIRSQTPVGGQRRAGASFWLVNCCFQFQCVCVYECLPVLVCLHVLVCVCLHVLACMCVCAAARLLKSQLASFGPRQP